MALQTAGLVMVTRKTYKRFCTSYVQHMALYVNSSLARKQDSTNIRKIVSLCVRWWNTYRSIMSKYGRSPPQIQRFPERELVLLCCATWGSALKHGQGKARQIRMLAPPPPFLFSSDKSLQVWPESRDFAALLIAACSLWSFEMSWGVVRNVSTSPA